MGANTKGGHQAPSTAATATATSATPSAATPTASTAKPVAAAAVTAASTAASSTTTTPHATSTNPIIAAIQNALISFFTSPSTIAQLTANGLNGPVAPPNLIGALLYGIYRGVENFAGLVPTGTATVNSSQPLTPITGNLNMTVPAGGPALTYTVASNPTLGTVAVNPDGTFTYNYALLSHEIAAYGFTPTDKFTLTASDGIASTNVTVTVHLNLLSTDVPSIPLASNITTNTATGVVTGTLSSTSPDGANVTFTVTANPTSGSVAVSGNTFAYTPTTAAQLTAGQSSTPVTDAFTVTAYNGQFTSSATVTVPISPIYAPVAGTPSVGSPDLTNAGAVTGTANFTDPQGLAVSYSVTTGPTSGSVTLNSTTGDYTYTPTVAARLAAWNGTSTIDSFTVTASNGIASSPETVTVPISPMQIPVGGSGSTAVVFSPNGNTAYVVNGLTISVINTATLAVTSTITNVAIGETAAITPDGKTLYVANFESGSISVVNTTTNTLTGTIATANADPLGLAVTPDGTTLYVTNYNASYANSSISAINTTTNAITQTIGVGGDPIGVAVSPDGKTVYVANSSTDTVSVINTATPATIAVGPTGPSDSPQMVAVSPTGSTLYVANSGTGTVLVIDTITNTITNSIAVGGQPDALAISPDGSTLYVGGDQSNTPISVVNTTTDTVTSTIGTNNPTIWYGLAVSPDGNYLYATNPESISSTVSVIPI